MLMTLSLPVRAGEVSQIVIVNSEESSRENNLNTISAVQLKQEIPGLGDVKCACIILARSKGDFESACDFEVRMKGQLSENMVYKIIKKYYFSGGHDDNKCGAEGNKRGDADIPNIQ